MIEWLKGWLADVLCAFRDLVPFPGWSEEDFDSAMRKIRHGAKAQDFTHRELQALRDTGMDRWPM